MISATLNMVQHTVYYWLKVLAQNRSCRTLLNTSENSEQAQRMCEDSDGEEKYPWEFMLLVSTHQPFIQCYQPINPSADYLSFVSPTREKSEVVYAPMRVITVLPKGIKDFPDGPVCVNLLNLSGVTVGEYDCGQDRRFASLRKKLAGQFKLEPHRVKLISVEGVELLDATLVVTLFPLLSTDAHDVSTDRGTGSSSESFRWPSERASSREDIQMQQEHVTTSLKASL